MNTYSLIHSFYKKAMDEYLYALYTKLIETHALKGNLLEIGCGVGEISKRSAHWFAQVDAFDINKKMIQSAMAASSPSNITFFTHDMHHPLKNQYSTIIAPIDVFNHCATEEAFIAIFNNWVHHLKAGGVMMFDLLRCEYLDSIIGYEESINVNNTPYSWRVKKGDTRCSVIHEVTSNDTTASHKEIAFNSELVMDLINDFDLLELIALEERTIYIIKKKTTS